MLKQHRTKEGESYVSMQALDVEVPAVMGGSSRGRVCQYVTISTERAQSYIRS